MAHYALLDDNNTVVNVIVGRDEDDRTGGVSDWEKYYGEFHGMRCIRTSYNTYGGVHYDPETNEPSGQQSKAFRFNYASIGHTYDETRDAFIAPKPFDSWVLDEETCLWVAPIPRPEDGGIYGWDEDLGDWVEVTVE